MHGKPYEEKRRHPRVTTRRKVRYRIIDSGDPEKVSRTLKGWVINISSGGLLLGVRELVTDGLHISYNEDVRKRNWLAIEMDLLPDRPSVRAVGRVVWYQRATKSPDYTFDAGIEFHDIREEDRKTIEDFVRRFPET